MDFSRLMPPSVVFTGALVGRIKRLLTDTGDYHAERGFAHGGGAHVLHVRDTEDGLLYRVTVEPEHVALDREERAARREGQS